MQTAKQSMRKDYQAVYFTFMSKTKAVTFRMELVIERGQIFARG